MDATPQPQKQIYLESDNGTIWKLTVNDDGMVVAEKTVKEESLTGS